MPMFKSTVQLMLLGLALLFSGYASGQCTPGDETTCPDPENNGQVCPATMPDATIDQMYSQEFTILPPPEYVLDSSSGTVIQLHHIKIKDVGNLPPGISWVSNAEDSIFMVGTYYCVLLDGTPTEKGSFKLEIEVDVYIPGVLGSPPIFVGTFTDSTSLSMNVTDPNGIGEFSPERFSMVSAAPNPFTQFSRLSFESAEPDKYMFELLDITGNLIIQQSFKAKQGLNVLPINGSELQAGVYLFKLHNTFGVYTGRLLKSH